MLRFAVFLHRVLHFHSLMTSGGVRVEMAASMSVLSRCLSLKYKSISIKTSANASGVRRRGLKVATRRVHLFENMFLVEANTLCLLGVQCHKRVMQLNFSLIESSRVEVLCT